MFPVGACTIKELSRIESISDYFEEYSHFFHKFCFDSTGHMITFVVLLYGRLFPVSLSVITLQIKFVLYSTINSNLLGASAGFNNNYNNIQSYNLI